MKFDSSENSPTDYFPLTTSFEEPDRLRELIDTLPDGYYRSTEEGNFIYANQAMARMLGYTQAELLSLDIRGRLYFDIEDRSRFDRTSTFPDRPNVLRLRHRDGSAVWVEDYPRDRYDDAGTLLFREGICKDITAQKHAEERLKSSLAEKEVLLREIHHRVKNNLQVVSSLLSLQRNRADDEGARQALGDSQRRIKAIAMVHEKLYTSESLAQVSFDEYIREVAAELCRFHDCTGIDFTYSVERVRLDVDEAVPCGLIFNELLTNALKHGFVENRSGRVTIGLRKIDRESVELSVAHDGAGVPEGLDIGQPRSMGMLLVTSLVAQLGGSIRVEGEERNRFVMRFAAG
ncbi:sensor histidine kinase [Salinispira pacifica]